MIAVEKLMKIILNLSPLNSIASWPLAAVEGETLLKSTR